MRGWTAWQLWSHISKLFIPGMSTMCIASYIVMIDYSMFMHDIVCIHHRDSAEIHTSHLNKLGAGHIPRVSAAKRACVNRLSRRALMGPGELGRIKSFYDDKGSNENVSFLIYERWNTAKASTQRLFPRGCLHTWCIFTDDSHGNVRWSLFRCNGRIWIYRVPKSYTTIRPRSLRS